MRQLIGSLLVLLIVGAFCLAPTMVQAGPAENLELGYGIGMNILYPSNPISAFNLTGLGVDLAFATNQVLPNLDSEIDGIKVQADAIAAKIGLLEWGFDLGMDNLYGPSAYDLSGLGYSLASVDAISAKVNTINVAVAANTAAISDLNAKLDTIIDLLTTPQGRRSGWNE